MAQNPNILSPRQPLATYKDRSGNDIQVFVDRTWWRFFDQLQRQAGALAAGVVIAPNSVITPGTINSGSTVTPADIPGGTLLGNSAGADAPASPQTVAPSLSLNDGTLAVANLAPFRLSGNPGPGVAPPGAIIIGSGLLLTGDILNVDTASGGIPSIGLLEAIAYWRP